MSQAPALARADDVFEQVGRREWETRHRRWRIFLWLFTFTSIAIGLDVLTTYVGFQLVGSGFEQNPVGLYLIEHIGWFGLLAVLAVACAACVISFRHVYWNMSVRWSLWLNGLVAIVGVFRWIVVISDTVWLIHPK